MLRPETLGGNGLGQRKEHCEGDRKAEIRAHPASPSPAINPAGKLTTRVSAEVQNTDILEHPHSLTRYGAVPFVSVFARYEALDLTSAISAM
jgi:hypothetical protein